MGNRRRSILDLTPLLDVVLLLLFAFMMMVTAQGEERDQEMEAFKEQTQAAISDTEDAKEQVNTLQAEKTTLQDNIDTLSVENQKLQNDIEQLQESNAELESVNDLEKESINQVIKGLAEFLDTNEAQIKKLIDGSDDELIDKLIDPKEAAAMLHRYKALSQQFYFIDVVLATEKNRLYVNNKATSVGINYEDIKDNASRSNKVDEVKDEIEAAIGSRQGGSAMIFVTLSVKDADVYQYAWDVVWDAIGELQEKYGTQKLYRTYIRWITE